MDELETLQEKYKKMSDEELITLGKVAKDLKPDAMNILQQELINRDFLEEAMHVGEFITTPNNHEINRELTREEVKQLIEDRVNAGESIENITKDLSDTDKDLFESIKEEAQLKSKAFDYITDLRQQGLSEAEIDRKLKDNLSIDSEIIKSQLRQSGKTNLIIGYSLATIALCITVGLLFAEQFSFGGMIVLGIGIWRIFKGYQQLK